MPILRPPSLRVPTQSEFGDISYRVMEVVFAVHHELGRFLQEDVYQREIASRLATAQIEVPITAAFEDFSKNYFLDLLVDGAALFEFKTAEKLAPRHQAQLINYLLLAEMPHGKLVNLRTEQVEHEFINSTRLRADRTCFEIDVQQWRPSLAGERDISDWLATALRDWGTGLDLALYVDACTHFFGGYERVIGQADILVRGRKIGTQSVRLAAPNVAFKITTLPTNDCAAFEVHARRCLAHTSLIAIQWINISFSTVRFKTLMKS